MYTTTTTRSSVNVFIKVAMMYPYTLVYCMRPVRPMGLILACCLVWLYGAKYTLEAADDVAIPTEPRLVISPTVIEPVETLQKRSATSLELDTVEQTAESAPPTFRVPLGLHAGTSGIGGFIGFSFTPYINTRLLVSVGSINQNIKPQFGSSAPSLVQTQIDKLSGTLELDFDSKMLLVDYHPFAGAFYFSFGAVQNANHFAISTSIAREQEFSFGNITIQPQEVGKLTAAIKFDKMSWYYGIGFGNYAIGSPFTFALDLGILVQGEPKATVDYTGFSTRVRNQLAEQVPVAVKEIESNDALKQLKSYPIARLSLSYRFDF